ncbi:MAG: peptidoglycan DD-metalloendopeptidase family protein [Oscillospiraceae bacterium]|jgi:murein DD-endopeptidase MepM/ murein hydrolase activator NlpD|nr:peptidoglycan DD-metalloendopeptidase family protein [Oscillospiraceae bacterium]
MNNKKFVRIVAVVLAVLMLLSVVMIAIDALANTTASARVTQGQIDNLRGEKREIERLKREIQSKINTIEFERMKEIEKKEVLDSRIMLTGLEIDNVNSIIAYYELLIREKEYEVFLAQGRENEQFNKYRSRVRDMEENGIISYLEIIFESTSFSDMLARIDFVADIMRADENAYIRLTFARSETEAAKESLENIKEEMDEEKVNLVQKEVELLEQLEEAHELIRRMEEDIETEKELRDLAIREENRVQREINAAVAELERQQELERQRRLREQQRQQGGVSTIVGTGELMWPASGRVSSEFGVRQHPVFGDLRQHNGIDISALHGANVVAADAGTVITSAHNSSYGNYIVISHGNGITTLYAHLSSRQVSSGTSVSKGQLIGLVGSTGVSTGPHLHFEVSVNGVRVNPRNRLS